MRLGKLRAGSDRVCQAEKGPKRGQAVISGRLTGRPGQTELQCQRPSMPQGGSRGGVLACWAAAPGRVSPVRPEGCPTPPSPGLLFDAHYVDLFATPRASRSIALAGWSTQAPVASRRYSTRTAGEILRE